jgi:hypothetical protein
MVETGPVFKTAVQLLPLFTERTTPPLVKLMLPRRMLDVALPAVDASTTRALKTPFPPALDRKQPVHSDQTFPPSVERSTPQPLSPPFPSPVAE